MKKNYFILLLALLCVLGAKATTIYAYRSYQRDAGDIGSVRGPVKFDTSNPRSITLIADQSKLGVSYAGSYYNYKWYAQITQVGTQSSVEGLYSIDLETGQRTLIARGGAQLTDMTYDYSTNTMYAIRNGAEKLATINMNTGKVTVIAPFTEDAEGHDVYMLALAADLNGDLYGIAANDMLYKVDKSTAKCTRIGNLTVDAAFTQSMCFDYGTHTLYWANNSDYGFYTVDLNTGKATLIGKLGKNGYDSLNSLFIPFIHVANGAPDRVLNRNFTVSGNDVTLVWTNPSVDAQGNDLADLTAVKIYRDNTLVGTVPLNLSQKGQESSYTDQQVGNGRHEYRIVPENSHGEGGYDTDNIVAAVGPNAPGPVENLTATAGDNTAMLKWSKPTVGLWGGDYDPNSITKYVVTRFNHTDSAKFEISDPSVTSFTDTPGFGRYNYRVVAYNHVGQGAEAMSNQVLVKPGDWIVMGTGTVYVEHGKSYLFYDYGGEGNYPNSENDTLTMMPAEAGNYLNLKFTEMSLDTYGDTIAIYNGSSVNAPLMGKYSSQSVPAELADFDAGNSEGALTFVFTSDVMGRDKGWKATVTAIEKNDNDLVANRLKANPRPIAQENVTYTVSITNKGTNVATGYQVQLIDGNDQVLATATGPELASMQSTDVNMVYAPQLSGLLEVRGRVVYDSDQDKSNNTTETLVQNVAPVGSKYISIATSPASEMAVVPASFFADESVSETIYPSANFDEVAEMELTMISYPYNKVTMAYPVVPLQVYVGEADIVDLTDGAIPARNLTKVFDGKIAINTTDEAMTVPFQNNYPYTGKNLVVMVYKNAPSTSNSGVTFNGTYGNFTSDPKYTRFDSKWSDDDTHFDLNENFGYAAQTQRADINCLFVGKESTAVDEPPTPACSVKGLHGAIEVDAPVGCDITICTLDGKVVTSLKSTSHVTVIDLAPNFYIAKIGSRATKVIVQ